MRDLFLTLPNLKPKINKTKKKTSSPEP